MVGPSEKVCSSCGSYSASLFDAQKSYLIYSCTECGFAFAEASPTAKLATYDEGYFVDFINRDEARGLDCSYARILESAELHAPGKSMLDLGCGVGGFLSFAKDRGWTVEGADGSPAAVNFVKTQLGVPVSQLDLNSFTLPESKYHFVNSLHVIEHLSEPRYFLDQINRSLKPGGIVVLGTPIYSMQRIRLHNLLHKLKVANHKYDYMLPDHVSFFSVSSLSKLLQTQRFEILQVWFTAHQNIGQLIDSYGDSSRLRRLVKSAARPATPILRKIGYHCHMNFLARKSP